MIKILVLLVAAVAGGILGRMGGVGKPFRSWMRDWVIPLVFLATFHFWFSIQWSWQVIVAYIVTYGFMGYSFTTYWDWLFDDKDNFWFSGFVVGLSAISLMYVLPHWVGLAIRCAVLATGWGLWNLYRPDKFWFLKDGAVIEELGRYAFVILTLPLLAI